jgi:mono/diheme cytochrome c family protein
MNKIKISFLALVTASLLATSCGSETGRAYMPDMAYSRAYEFYSDNPNFKDSITAQSAVAGTIARGALLPDHIGEFDTVAARTNTCGYEMTLDQITEGGRLYQIQCGICHGNNLDGNGPLYNGGNGKFAAAPANFKDAKYLNMPVGTMYHAIMYGKNMMGSYASQLDARQRWMVLAYIKDVQSKNGGTALTSSFKMTGTTDSTHTTPTKTVHEIAVEAGKTVKHEEAKKVEVKH